MAAEGYGPTTSTVTMSDEPPAENDAPRLSRLVRRQRAFLWITTGAAVVAAGGLAASTLVRSPAQEAADQGPPTASILTAPIVRQVLTQQVVFQGTVQAGKSIEVTPGSEQGADVLVITKMTMSAGSVIRPGDVLIQVSGRPLIALPGTTPAYRDLKPGESGPDILELQSALASLGYADNDQPGFFGAGTKAAVAALYQHLGYSPATTGGPGDAADQPAISSDSSAVAVARQTVASDLALVDAAHTPAATATALAAWRSAKSAYAAAESALASLIADTGVELPLSEFVFLPSFPASIASINGTVGSSVASPLLTINVGQLTVTGVLPPGDQGIAKAGMKAELTNETLSQDASGVVQSVGPYSDASQSSASGSSSGAGQQQYPGYPTSISASSLPESWLGDPVQVTITGVSSGGPVLTVPISAVASEPDGATTVTVLKPDGTEVRIPVGTGMIANGLVQVTPLSDAGLRPGERVVTG
jgi:peptidoglycan hydrolase-like protein with peptidoglycan-binding domain